ncbi:hypothetical protein [Acidisphaera rubrifaciens]|uniref:Uncharacterized protein n=1 Tax=Acidisphaera rubrifaciens HS-AP3 TaxID=1231350 RepID=A0A0D6P3J5_9PROT|nr:hypothetical protein [Acidisphaera rubrifaciens]GAN75916.1 hypothetical protein Asru_0023_06 [Acidisphaera rubrifaciens HS-AP3]
MAKGQKRSNREAKKPKQPKVKPVAGSSVLAGARTPPTQPPAKKG